MIIKQLRIVHCFLSVNRSVIRPPDVSQEGLKFLPMNFLFYQSTALSSHAVDGHQTYFRGSVIGKASTIGIEISPTHSPNFHRRSKVRNLASFPTSLNFQPLAFENAARYLNAETNFL